MKHEKSSYPSTPSVYDFQHPQKLDQIRLKRELFTKGSHIKINLLFFMPILLHTEFHHGGLWSATPGSLSSLESTTRSWTHA